MRLWRLKNNQRCHLTHLQRTIRAAAAGLPSRGLEYQTSGDPGVLLLIAFPFASSYLKVVFIVAHFITVM